LLIANKEHLTQEGLEKIITLKGSINRGFPDKLKESFPNITPMIRPNYTPSGVPLNPYWISGFTEGDASFSVSMKSSGRVVAVYSIGLNEREEPLLIKIRSFFGTGNINKTPNNKAVYFQITAINDINLIIIKHFDSYTLLGAKLPNYLIWREIISIMKVKGHLSLEGKMKIKSLIENLNK